MVPVFSMIMRCYFLGISIVAYALLIGHSNGAGDVATGCLMDINETGQREKNTLALEDEIVFLPRPASLPCSILVLLIPSGPYSLGRAEPLHLCGSTAGFQVGNLDESQVLSCLRT